MRRRRSRSRRRLERDAGCGGGRHWHCFKEKLRKRNKQKLLRQQKATLITKINQRDDIKEGSFSKGGISMLLPSQYRTKIVQCPCYADLKSEESTKNQNL